MKLYAYVLSNADEIDVLPSALNSLSFVDRIYLVDGGTEVGLFHTVRKSGKLFDLLGFSHDFDGMHQWHRVPIEIIEHPWQDPTQQRNWILDLIANEPDKPDWILALDSDEICSNEMIAGLRQYLEELPSGVTNVTVPILTLLQDQKHCAGGQHSTWLAHARITRPNSVSYVGRYHEHQNFVGDRARCPLYLVHTRMLFRDRLYKQRNAPVLKEAWRDLTIADIPSGVTWDLVWPDSEPRDVPWEADMRTYGQ